MFEDKIFLLLLGREVIDGCVVGVGVIFYSGGGGIFCSGRNFCVSGVNMFVIVVGSSIFVFLCILCFCWFKILFGKIICDNCYIEFYVCWFFFFFLICDIVFWFFGYKRDDCFFRVFVC